MGNTYLDELVEYPVKALHAIGLIPEVVQLLMDDPDINEKSDEAEEIFDKYLFDYGYVDNSTEEASAFICVEAECAGTSSYSVKDMRLYVTVYCHKRFMDIDVSKFPGLVGSRRDNLIRYADSALNGSDVFGIGALQLASARVVPAPTGFAARELTYVVPEFSRRSR